ncbi:hypothetical protein [Enterovibrio norvegicus]|uniref:Uncharacterized protein n=1 Tax=Enterovibrio norvegicus TaxID=188144 RepID=A0ABV4L991_9GAMM|nr:hypothetical protein [Enterovibrio norvegicus]OEF55835.1 hypothetical protein A1OU_13690 [Enterovibrio norvegicus]
MISQVKASIATAEPIMLSISPDWPSIIVTGAIGLGSVLTSIGVVYVTRSNQKSQSKAKLAELRKEALTELQNTAAEFIGVCTNIRSCRQNGSFSGNEFDQLQTKAYTLQANIFLSIELDTQVGKDIKRLTDKVINESSDFEVENLIYLKLLDKLNENFKLVLNKRWLEISSALN